MRLPCTWKLFFHFCTGPLGQQCSTNDHDEEKNIPLWDSRKGAFIKIFSCPFTYVLYHDFVGSISIFPFSDINSFLCGSGADLGPFNAGYYCNRFAFSTSPGGGAGILNKVLDREVPPRGPTPTLLYHWQKRYPFRIPSIEKWYSFIPTYLIIVWRTTGEVIWRRN